MIQKGKIIMAYEDLIFKIEQIKALEKNRKKEYYNSILSKLKTLEDMNYIERCRKMIETRERILDSSFLAALEIMNHEDLKTPNLTFKFRDVSDEIIVGNDKDENIAIICDVKNKRESKFNFTLNALTYYTDFIHTNIHTQEDKIVAEILSKCKIVEGIPQHPNGSETIQIDENKIVNFPMFTPELLQSVIDEFNEFENQFYEICEQIVDKAIQESGKALENDTKTECGDVNENNGQ